MSVYEDMWINLYSYIWTCMFVPIYTERKKIRKDTDQTLTRKFFRRMEWKIDKLQNYLQSQINFII